MLWIRKKLLWVLVIEFTRKKFLKVAELRKIKNLPKNV